MIQSNDLLSRFTVKVCEGSGCLFAPAQTEYYYVLTTKHNMENQEAITVSTHYLDADNKVIEQVLEVIGLPYLHSDEHKDAAIIKVKPVEQEVVFLTTDNPLVLKKTLKLAGHPESRKGNEFTFRLNDLKIQNTSVHGYIEGQLEDNASHDEVIGQSGGGIFFIDGRNIFLVGIQSRMAANDQERLGRVDFMPLTFFREIVDQNQGELCKLIPHYLLSFSFLKEQVMLLEGCIIEKNVTFTRGYLKQIADKIIASNLTPLIIKNIFNEKLIAHDQLEENLSDKGLWIAWLEFLIIMQVVNNEIANPENIEEIFNSYRLIYSTTEGEWTGEIANIIRSDYRGLKKDGKIIIATQSKPLRPFIPSGMITDIIQANSVQSDQLKIDTGIVHPLSSYKLFHLHAFQQQCIILKETEYKDYSVLNENDLLAKLQNEYDALFAQA